MLIGITGLCEDLNGNKRIAGSGKDEVSRFLRNNYSFVNIAWADAIKRIGQQIYNFSDDCVWGSSENRILPDKRYKRDDGTYLTVREFLQTFGTDAGRKCYKNTWVDYTLNIAKKLIDPNNDFIYYPKFGLISAKYFIRFMSVDTGYLSMTSLSDKDLNEINNQIYQKPKGVVFSDLRFFNEFDAIKAFGGKVVRVKRKLNTEFDSMMNNNHLSEIELLGKNDCDFDYVLENYGSLDDLESNVKRMYNGFNE